VSPVRATKLARGLGAHDEDRLRELWSFSFKKTRLSVYSYLQGRYREDRATLFSKVPNHKAMRSAYKFRHRKISVRNKIFFFFFFFF